MGDAPLLVIGIDHSLTAFGVAAVRPNWELDFSRVRRATWETPTGMPGVERRARLARSLCDFICAITVEPFTPLSSVHVAIEGGMFMRGKASSIRSQERLAGVVEHELWKLGIELVLAEQRAVRTTFMGASLSGGKGAGAAAQALLHDAAPATRHWFEAELDAFLVANHELSLAGEAFVSCAPPVEPPKEKRRGKRTQVSQLDVGRTG